METLAKTTLSIALGFLSIASVSGITIDDQSTFGMPRTWSPGGNTITKANFGTFDPSGSDKLIVILGYRSSGTPGYTSVTYNGVAMTQAVQHFNAADNRAVTGIYYLDDPGAAGDLVVSTEANGFGFAASLLAVSGTAPGVGNTSSAPAYTTSLTVESGSLVVAQNSNTNNVSISAAQSPLIEMLAHAGGNDAGSHTSGYVIDPGAGTFDPTFSTAGSNPSISAAEFLSAGGGGDSFALTITPATAPDTGFDLEWDSQAGKLYNVRTSTDLSGAIPTWTLVEGDIEATPPTNTYNVNSADPRRFYAVEEYDAPPPPPLLSEDFEEDDGDFTVSPSPSEGSAWEWGVPDSNNGQSPPAGLVLTAGNSGTKAWATNLGTADNGFYTNPTTTFLRSPVVNLSAVTSAELTFAEAVDFATTDTAEVYVISDSDGTEIAGPIHTSSTGAVLTADWTTANSGAPIALPPAALGQSVRLEWRFTGGTDAFLGWYIDDVVVTGTTP